MSRIMSSVYVPIVCAFSAPNAAEADTMLSYVDGANTMNTVLQICIGLLHLGTALGTGCSVPVINVVCT